jgi:hypothetical protein
MTTITEDPTSLVDQAIDQNYPQAEALPVPVPQEETSDVEQQKMFEFSEARTHLQRIVNDWSEEAAETEKRRKERDVDVNVAAMREAGDLDEDETLIPVRVIDTNIIREQPPYVNYLKNSRRLMTFRSLDNPSQDPQLIEQEFTRGMTYSGWETEHYKVIDGSQTHGWACIEVVFDSTKPLNCGLEYIAHDELYWPKSIKKLQDAPRIIRKYEVTNIMLRSWVRDFEFNPEQVNIILAPRKDSSKEPETVTIYKHMFKKEGIVYVAWFSLDSGSNDWLKAPEKLFIGIYTQQEVMQEVQVGTDPFTGQPINQPMPSKQWVEADVTIYPYFKLPYRETEKPKAVDNKGRVFLDGPKQEAQTAILSGFVNGITRASNVYASPSQEDGTGAAIQELENVKLMGGRIFNRPINFFNPPYPAPMLINALQYLDVSNSNETNQTNFAVMNREDSRKTATEIGAAQQEQTKLTSVQLTLFSTYIREVYSFAWLIVQSQALIGAIKFLLVPGQQDPMTGQTALTNDVATIGQTWELRSAGDVDVIQRQEKIAQMKQDWPVVAATPLALRFLTDLMKLEYPEVGDQYAAILNTGNPAMLLQAMAAIVQGIFQAHPELLAELPPEQQQQLMQIMQASAQTIQVNQQQQQPGKTNDNGTNQQ